MAVVTRVLTAAQRREAAAMSEEQLEAKVKDMARKHGLVPFDQGDARRQKVRGWPDLVIIGGRDILYRELKTERGLITLEQRRVGSLLAKGGGNWSTWRPHDLIDGTIERQIAEVCG